MRPEPCEADETRADLPAPDAWFGALFRDHFGFVYQNLRRLGVPPALLEDAAQEVFLVVLRRQDAPVTTARGWLFGIARKIAWRYRRSAGRQHRLAEALAEETRTAVDGVHAVAEREAAALLDRFLGRLDDDKRAVFLLAELEQMTAPEIARALEVKENTVYSRLRAARQEFDRTFARVRLRERRATGEAALDERTLLLSRARRAGAPDPQARQRVALLLWGPAGVGTALAAGEAAAAPAAAGAHASAHTVALLGKPAAVAKLGGVLGSHTAWAAVIGVVGVTAVLARPTPAPAPAAPVAVTRPAEPRSPAAATDDDDDARVPFARLAAAAERARRSDPDGARRRANNVPKDMSQETATQSPAAAPDPGALPREAGLMADARAAVRGGEWPRARALLERHALEFPAGALVDERRLLLISALCATGAPAAARAEATRLANERPGSAIANKARTLCPAPSGG